jgi:hypothetical protein
VAPIQNQDARRERAGRGRSSTCKVWAGSCHPCFLAMAPLPLRRHPPECPDHLFPFSSRPAGGSKSKGGTEGGLSSAPSSSLSSAVGLVPGSSVLIITRKEKKSWVFIRTSLFLSVDYGLAFFSVLVGSLEKRLGQSKSPLRQR